MGDDEYVDDRDPVVVDIDEELTLEEAAATALADVAAEPAYPLEPDHDLAPAAAAHHHAAPFDLDAYVSDEVDDAIAAATRHGHEYALTELARSYDTDPEPEPVAATVSDPATEAVVDPAPEQDRDPAPMPPPSYQPAAEHRSEYYGSGPRVIEPELEPAYAGGTGRVRGCRHGRTDARAVQPRRWVRQ